MRAIVIVLSTDHSTMPTVAIAVLSDTFTVNVAIALEVPPLPPVLEPVPDEPPVMPPAPEIAPAAPPVGVPPVLVEPPFPFEFAASSEPQALAKSDKGTNQAADCNQPSERCIKEF